MMLFRANQRFGSISRKNYFVACRLQKFARNFAHVLFVFGKQNGFGSAHHLRSRRCLRRILDGGVHSRQINLERRALPQFAIRPNKSTALFYYSVYGRKP